MSVPTSASTSTPLLPPAVEPRDTGAASAVPSWHGDDQEWWDWYMTLADNTTDSRTDEGATAPSEAAISAEVAALNAELAAPDFVPTDAHATAGRNSAAEVATEEEVLRHLNSPYPLKSRHLAAYRRQGFVRLPGVLAPSVVAALARRADELLDRAHGGPRPGRFLALEQLWLTDELMRAVALSPRLGALAARLTGADRVRLYHDNLLSKESGCGRTPWHRDADHYPLDTTALCTSWVALHDIPAEMGPLACLPNGPTAVEMRAVPFTLLGTDYDRRLRSVLDRTGGAPDATPFRAGDVSFHSAACFHTAGPNRTGTPRRVLSSTYYADGTRVSAEPTLLSGAWTDFLPGVAPGESAVSPLNPVVGTQPQP
ncbi:phytanoyl-CoA dioxygenase family protein [Streptomyces sp. NA04227]|uniref:phytanoyl-CoA dioxygenase family protein n=1 Tax=Streptomyces sp. NA04227 TaxID=2742136 RepID=UPI0015908FB4|nr:phytanoyl-CoA dioxygenase family protein [Streptomyces sp. NA04227]QKW07415.1 phytanoyl-CoA dioxygenase family protein [Streptomyces sp. NA04227]